MIDHERFEELATLAAIGELSVEEHDELLCHAASCSKCDEIVAETSSVAALAFLAGSPGGEDSTVENARYHRAREVVAQRLPMSLPRPFAHPYKTLTGTGIAATLLVAVGLIAGVILGNGRGAIQRTSFTASPSSAQSAGVFSSAESEAAQLRTIVADLQKQIDQASRETQALKDRLLISDQNTRYLESRLEAVARQSNDQARELEQARSDLNAARNETSQAQVLVSSRQATIDDLRYQLTDKEARLTEVTASVVREREMLSAGREIRDIMGARDLHIVDVIDRDGKGRPRKALGRAFYTQGKSLIFYAFDLPAKNTADGKFVYAAWGSNSNSLGGKVAHSLGIFYNDDQTQHRWAMKFDDPKVLEEIDTVFVTLEPAGRPFAAPTGKAILEAYFGTPPNHP